MWQDQLIAVTSILFAYALAVQVYHGFEKKKGLVHLQTSTIFAVGSLILAYSFYTLGLFFAAIVSLMNGSLWVFLFVQKIIYHPVQVYKDPKKKKS